MKTAKTPAERLSLWIDMMRLVDRIHCRRRDTYAPQGDVAQFKLVCPEEGLVEVWLAVVGVLPGRCHACTKDSLPMA